MGEAHEKKISLTEVKYQNGKLKEGINGARRFRWIKKKLNKF